MPKNHGITMVLNIIMVSCQRNGTCIILAHVYKIYFIRKKKGCA